MVAIFFLLKVIFSSEFKYFVHKSIIFSNIFYKKKLELRKLKIFLAEQNLKIEKKKINDILSLLVPTFVKELMYQGIFLTLNSNNFLKAISQLQKIKMM